MLITAIEPRRKALSALFLDGELAMELDTETLRLSGFRLGSDITDEELYQLREDSESRRATERALYILERRNHFRHELEEKLRRSFSAAAAQRAAERMQELGLIDDAAYGRDYARRLLLRKGFSGQRVRQELCRKGLDREMAGEIAEELALELVPDPANRILELLQRKYPGAAHDEKQRRRAVNALQRLGYRLSDVRQALRQMDETIEIYEDEE